MQFFRLIFCCALLGFTASAGSAEEKIPPKPTQYFNDYAQLVSTEKARALNQRLEQFERDTSNQLVVAVFPRMESSSSVEDFTVRIAQSWGVGRKGSNNGAVLFLFMAEHKVYIQVGYGLEGALPDALCHTIIENEIKPRFRAGDYAGGLDAATDAIIAATKGEYRGTGQTNAEASGTSDSSSPIIPAIIIIAIILTFIVNRRRQPEYTSFGRRRSAYNDSNTGWWGGWGGGGSDSGSSGGFSGGGGSFGGGGSGGSW